ncbi:hypothetical protein, partial [Corynebacterium appendicis]|uniref:hypothetical protein n=1 Tax=Corynebacterium appendicis TaxID=163202 RepID=UPI00235729B3
MNQFAALVGAGNAIDMLGSFNAQLLIDAGANPTRVAEWKGVFDTYYGKTREASWFSFRLFNAQRLSA